MSGRPTFEPQPVQIPWRLILYGLVLLYLLCDLYLIGGPLQKRLTARPAVPEGTVATANGWPIMEAELNRDIAIYCFTRGIDPATLEPKRRDAIRAVVLNRRIDEIVIYQYSRLDPKEVTTEELDAAVARFRSQFVNDETFAERLETQGLDEKGLRSWLKSRLAQAKWIEERVADVSIVTEEEARSWYDDSLDAGFVPEVLRARHLFLTLDDTDAETVESAIREHHAAIKIGGDSLADRATEYSNDDRSNKNGGDLGYFTKFRMPADFYDVVAVLKTGEISQPFKTSLGWHIAELTERKESRRATFEEMKEEITALLENNRRTESVDQLVRQMRKMANVRVLKN